MEHREKSQFIGFWKLGFIIYHCD